MTDEEKKDWREKCDRAWAGIMQDLFAEIARRELSCEEKQEVYSAIEKMNTK